MKSIFRIFLLISLNIYAFILCFGSLIWINATACLFYLISRFIFLVFKTNFYNGFYFIFPFQTFEQWKEYLSIIKSFIQLTSFSETYSMLYYKYRNWKQDATVDLPYFKFPDIKSTQIFYNPLEFPEWNNLVKNNVTILNEYLNAKINLKPYVNEAGLAHNDWNTIMLYGNGQLIEKIKPFFPETLNLINMLPDVEYSMIMFSVLVPGASIPSHTGPFNSFLRVHLPLVLPERTEFCTINVSTETRYWEKEELLIFDDSYLHSVSNNTTEVRVILMLSVWKPNIQPEIRKLILKFINLFNSSLPLKQWISDNS